MSTLLPRLARLERHQETKPISFITKYFDPKKYIDDSTNRTPERAGALTGKTNNLVPISIITGTRHIGGII